MVSINSVFPYLISIFASLILLNWLYKLLKVKWPEYYFSVSEENSLYMSQKPHRLFTFRAIPIFIVILPILGMMGRDYGLEFPVITGLLIGIIHSFMSNGKAIVLLITNSQDIKTYFNKPTQIVFHIITIVFCVFCGYIAGYLAQSDLVKNSSPSLLGMRDNLWATGIVVLFGIYSFKNYKNAVDMDEVFKKILDTIPTDLKIFLIETCEKHNVNPSLAMAICLTESIQRPLWVRRLEHFKSFFYKPGTYGIMQVQSNYYLPDKESIKLGIKKLESIILQVGSTKTSEIIKQYNSSENFKTMVQKAYDYLDPFCINE